MDIPPFHPEWLVTFWLSTPGLNRLDPHMVLLLATGGFIGFYLYRKNRKLKAEPEWEEERFQQLMTRKKRLEQDLEELEREHGKGEIASDCYLKKRQELEMRLEMTEHQLRQFT
ncbi:MAG: hypothetical protein WB502_08845 [Thermoactinomyces sp.]